MMVPHKALILTPGEWLVCFKFYEPPHSLH